MLKIALCDDDPNHLHHIISLFRHYLASRPNFDGQIAAFSSGTALLEQVRVQNGFDLYLLDVLMPGLNGIQTGHKLRELDCNGEIIYLSTSKDYAADSYDVHAFFYLLKPVSEEKLFLVLDAAAEKLDRQQDAILVDTKQGFQRLLLARIRYVERAGRALRYYCTDGIVESKGIRSTFRDATAPLLADPRFCLCGASFVLNFQHVVGVNGQCALLDDDTTVTLPRTSAVAFKHAWGEYWLEMDTALP